MLFAVALLLFPAPQTHPATTDSTRSKPVMSAAVRPLLLPKEISPAATSAEASGSVPEIALNNSFAADVPGIARMKHAEPPPPANYFPEAPLPHLAASSISGSNTFEAPIKPATSAPHFENVVKKRLWYGLLGAGHAAAAFDAYSTRRVMSQNLATERNPLLRPFAHSNSLYVAVQASPLLMDFLGRKMMTSEHPWVRRMWWVPQSAGTAASMITGIHNMRISQ